MPETVTDMLNNNKSKILELVDMIQNDKLDFIQTVVMNPEKVDENTVSIAMTTHNRVDQMLFTLSTINKSAYKNVQVVIVDDSTIPFDVDQLKMYDFRIDYVKIENSKKIWINPCVNYNIAFKYCLGSKVIIQNSEVCHVGDVVSYVVNSLNDANYLVFDVVSSRNQEANRFIYSLPYDPAEILDYCISSKFEWYQHHLLKNRGFHFLTAITKKNLDNIEGFDWDMSYGSWYDDDILVLKIKCVLGLTFTTVPHDKESVYGIHLHHMKNTQGNLAYAPHLQSLNRCIVRKKEDHFRRTKEWLEIYKT